MGVNSNGGDAKKRPLAQTTTKNEIITIKEEEEEEPMEVVEIKKDNNKNDDDDDDDDNDKMEPLDKEQLEEYSNMLNDLGNFADKVQINTLSMVAEDYNQSTKSSKLLYEVIRKHLLDDSSSSTSSPARKLPLVYVIDSILKNAKGKFVSLMEDDAKNWLGDVYRVLGSDGRMRLKKVWNTWRQFGIFGVEAWEEMGECFRREEEEKLVEQQQKKKKSVQEKIGGGGGGLRKRPDGSLDIPQSLRREMQILLDDMHTGVDELEKVSLERLADIKPALLEQIKTIAEDILSSGGSGGGASGGGGGTAGRGGTRGSDGGNMGAGTGASSTNQSSSSSMGPAPFTETRHPNVIQRSDEWNALDIDYNERVHEIIGSLQHSVRIGGSGGEITMTLDNHDDETVPSADVKKLAITDLFASASATANHLTTMMQQRRTMEEESSKRKNASSSSVGRLGAGPPRTCLSVDQSKFTTEGLRERNDTVIALLYDAGLPFVSSSDGRRFATQIELSNHLDELFRRSQIEKTMERTEERGWYCTEGMWTGRETAKTEGEDATSASKGNAEEPTPETSTVFADESRDRCVVCGINFEMFFDQDEGEYKYRNCREVNVVDQDTGSKESDEMLVHVTCLRGLGSPEFLMMHQILHKH